MEQKNILAAFGGASPEHEVSVITAHQAMAALQDHAGYKIKPLYISKSGLWFTGPPLLDLRNFENLKKLQKQCISCHLTQNEFGQTILRENKQGLFSKPAETPIHAVLVAFHGSNGENGSFQGICEMYNLPYTGSGVLGSAVGMNKVTAKSLCRDAGISVVESIDFFETEWVENSEIIINKIGVLSYPVIVKPVHLGSSIGVEIVHNRTALELAVETAFRYDRHLLVEKVVTPLMEINCSVIGSGKDLEASVCERPLGKKELLSFQDKYLADEGTKGMASADREIPAKIPGSLTESIREASKKIFRTLSCSGIARLDFLVNTDTQEFYFNEINTIPGSFSFYLWKESGLSFTDLLEKIINIGLKENQLKNRQIQSYDTNLLSKKAVKGLKSKNK